jgi:hypothetical protein
MMKKVILSVTGCALALGLVAAPVANAKSVPHQTKVTVKHVTTKAKASAKDTSTETHTAKASAKDNSTKTHTAKSVVKKVTPKVSPAKLKEVQKFLSPVSKNIDRVDTNLQTLTKKVTDFYANTTSYSSEQELDFYNGALGKLKADSKQLVSYKKQLDQLSKKYVTADVLTATYQQVSDLQSSIKNEFTTLDGLHKSFVPTAPTTTAPTTTAPTTSTPTDSTGTTSGTGN